MSDPTSQQRLGAVVALSLLALGGALFTLRRAPRHETPAALAAPPTPGALPRDPLAYVPASTRLLVVADLTALRRAPATRRWFAPEPSGDVSPCQAELARRIRTVVLAVPRLPVDDFAFVAAGDVSPADLSACVPDAVPVEREGQRVVELRSRRDGGDGAMLAWTPAGVVLVGPVAMVDAMLDRGFEALHGRRTALALDPLRRHVRDGSAAWALALPGDDRAPPDDPLASVTGGALSIDVGAAFTLDGVLLCGDEGRARRVADALARAREGVRAEITEAPVRDALDRVSADVDGPTVRVRATVEAAAIASAIDRLATLARGLGSYLATPQRDR